MLRKPGSLRGSEILWVVTPIINQMRYHSRYRLFEQYRERLAGNPHVRLITVEVAFGDRKHQVTEAGNPLHVQLRAHHELWLKENMINVGISRIPDPEWRYVAWVDGDVSFAGNPHWAEETLHQLQHHKIVQMFRDMVDLDPTGGVLQVHTGFAYLYRTGAPKVLASGQYGNGRELGFRTQNKFWNPGYAWAATRDVLDDTGGLLDWAIVGSADHHMSCAWIGQVQQSMPRKVSPGYQAGLLKYQKHCERFLKRDLGYVDGTALHFWHGRKRERFYKERWAIVIDNQFEPASLRRDHQGLWQLDPDDIPLREDLRSYFRSRNEDSIDL